jgi:hypothetical protein
MGAIDTLATRTVAVSAHFCWAHGFAAQGLAVQAPGSATAIDAALVGNFQSALQPRRARAYLSRSMATAARGLCMDKSVLVPLGLFFSIVYSIKLLVDARMRYLFMKGGTPDTVSAMLAGEEQLRRMGTLRWGVVLTALAMGVGVTAGMSWAPLSAPGIAMLLGALGVGNLLAFAVAHKLGPPHA